MIFRWFVIIATVLACLTLASQPAKCIFCPDWECFGDCGFDHCVCLVPPGGHGGGVCVGVYGTPLSPGWKPYGQ